MSKLKKDLTARIKSISNKGEMIILFSKEMIGINDTALLFGNKTLIINLEKNNKISRVNNWTV